MICSKMQILQVWYFSLLNTATMPFVPNTNTHYQPIQEVTEQLLITSLLNIAYSVIMLVFYYIEML